MTAEPPPPGVEAANGASRSSFYTAMRLMPPPERAAMFAIYGFCRVVDDIADDEGPSPAERRAALSAWRGEIDALFAGVPGLATADLVEPVRRFSLARQDFMEIIDGMEMDVGAPIVAPPFEQLDLYCDRVASAVGRLSVRVFGMDEGPGRTLAHHLGRALQLTNILRDLDEDAAMGRLYLPAEALAAAGIAVADPRAVLADPRIDKACRWVAPIALGHYREADRVLAAKAAGKLRTPRLMGAVYGDILRLMQKAGWSAPRARVKIGKARLAWILLRFGLLE
ncbi:MAG TPA: presqualene diphosphate synthase HpnD [Caulobacteraceae bacterium]